LNMVPPKSGNDAYYYPEYTLNLGRATTAVATDISSYSWNGVYRRDYQNGLVLVNPGKTSITLDLGGTYQNVTATGGGVLTDASLDASGNYIGGHLNYAPVTQVTLAPGTAAILMKNGPVSAVTAPSNFTATAGDGQL